MTHGQFAPPAGYPPAPAAPRMPGIAAAAAVLGFVEAGVTVAVVSYATALLGLSPFGLGGDSGGAIVALAVTVVLVALLLLGSLALVRGTGRRLLIGATVAEILAVLGLVVWAVVDASTGSVAADYGTGVSGYDPLSSGSFGASSAASSVAAGVATLVLGLSLPVVRLCLAAQRSVGDWLRQRPPAPPVWSVETQQWEAAPRSVPGVAIALLAPVVLVLGLGIVVLTSSAPYPEPTDDLYGAGSPWSGMYDGGAPVAPPSSDSDEYDSYYADLADDCYDGDLGACDDLYSESPVGSLYEWLGGTCGGREATIIDTTCE